MKDSDLYTEMPDEECYIPPIGWRCTRKPGHDGPCAAVACPEDIAFVERGMKRLREADTPTEPPKAQDA